MIYGAMKVVIGGPLKVAFRPWVEGIENIPADGPAILASNHLSFSDSFFLPTMLDRKVTFIAKAEYFTTPGVKGRMTAAFFKGVGQLPVDRSGGRGSRRGRHPQRHRGAGARRAVRYLPGGHPLPGRPPLPRQARRPGPGGAGHRRPVIPVAMIDTEKIQPPARSAPS